MLEEILICTTDPRHFNQTVARMELLCDGDTFVPKRSENLMDIGLWYFSPAPNESPLAVAVRGLFT
mgnify:CR=1 FL=1